MEISRDREFVDRPRLYTWLADSYWADDRSREVIDRSLENADCWTVTCDGEMVAFARVVTDRATFAWLCDVFVGEPFRGQGYSRALLNSILSCPDYEGVRWMLGTRDAHGLYEKFGFKLSEGNCRWMVRGFRPRFEGDE